jgi:microsomal dipeptidase-like Zn-dependent dipeptidase
LPALIGALRQSGYSEALLQKLGTANWLNVLERTIG